MIAPPNIRFMVDVCVPQEFLRRLLDVHCQVGVELVGFPSPLLQQAPWDTGWRELSEHLVYLILGDACQLEGDGPTGICQRLEPGTWLCCPPGVRFRLSAAEGTVLIERFRLRLERDGQIFALGDRPLIVPQAWSLGEAMGVLVQAEDQDAPDAEVRRRAHLVLLFSAAFRLQGNAGAAGPSLSSADRTRLRLFVRRRLPQWPSPADLARELKLSPDYFARVFRRSLGLSPRAWLVDERIRCAAASLLETTEPVSVVAAAHGYDDLTLFGRQFRRVMGQPPRAWREQHRTFALDEVG